MLSDRDILQPLVERIAELAGQPVQRHRKQMWADHQALFSRDPKGSASSRPKIPVCVYFEGIPEPTWQGILGGDYLRCADPLARSIERDLCRRLYVAANVPDDHIVWPAVFVPARVAQPVTWGVPLEHHQPKESLGAYAYAPPLAGTGRIDVGRVHFADQVIDSAATVRDVERANELVGCPSGRLTVYVQYPTLGYCPFDLLVEIRGLEQVMMDAIDRPEELAALMDVIATGFQQHHENRQRLGHINRHISSDGRWQVWGQRVHCYHPPNNAANSAHTAGPFSRDPKGSASPRDEALSDEWAYISAQTSSGFGPGLFGQLVHPYNVRLAGYFTNQTVYFHGCETLDRKLDVLATLPNLRRLHVSPWSSVPAAVAKFHGRVVLEVHAHPGKVFFGGTADSIRAELRELVAQAEGTPIDLNLSDIHSVDGKPETLGLWARIAQEMAAQ